MKIEMLKAEVKDLKERYECKTDALNAALMTIDSVTKENDRMRVALERILSEVGTSTLAHKIASEALEI
jgi:hypothetical protein